MQICKDMLLNVENIIKFKEKVYFSLAWPTTQFNEREKNAAVYAQFETVNKIK